MSGDGRSAHYVGRSAADLGREIVNSANRFDGISHFWYEYCSSEMAAYKRECELYHEYAPALNAIHPAVPEGTNWRCPNEDCQWG